MTRTRIYILIYFSTNIKVKFSLSVGACCLASSRLPFPFLADSHGCESKCLHAKSFSLLILNFFFLVFFDFPLELSHKRSFSILHRLLTPRFCDLTTPKKRCLKLNLLNFFICRCHVLSYSAVAHEISVTATEILCVNNIFKRL